MSALRASVDPRHERVAAEPVLRFQRRILEGRPGGAVDLPGIGQISWPVAVALFDTLLGAVWIDTKAAAREVLFARIARDLGTASVNELAEAYQGLAILAWMFEAWPMRTQAALQCCAPCALAGKCSAGRLLMLRYASKWRRCSGQRGLMNGKIVNAVGGAPGSTPCRRPGTNCVCKHAVSGCHIDTPESMAIADMRDGLSVEAAAEVADVRPRTLYRWIKRGAQGGLQAALERPSGQLSGSQAIQLAEWIAATSPDGPRWRTNRVQNEALRRFGVGITVYVADRLLRLHGPWRRRKILLRRRLTVAPVYD